jgi:hypothetical protein
MQKDCAAKTSDARALIMARRNYEIIGFIATPQLFMACVKWKGHRTIIGKMAWGVAPTVGF